MQGSRSRTPLAPLVTASANDGTLGVGRGPDARATRPTDARILRALDALLARPREKWTVKKLAKIAGLSRAAFARRFASELGLPPLRYLARLRIARVGELLRVTDRTLSELAYEVGYANEFALSRAFRRLLGEPPATYRRRVRSARAPRPPICLAA